jgi:hypothetical protein
VGSTVEDSTISTEPAVPLDATASFDGDVTASIVGSDEITTTAIGPGEIAGAGIALTVEISNQSDTAINLDSVFVTVLGSDKSPALPTSGDPAAPFTGELSPGGTARGVYTYTISPNLTDPVSVAVSYTN